MPLRAPASFCRNQDILQRLALFRACGPFCGQGRWSAQTKDKVPPPQTSTAFFSTNDASLDRCVVAHCHRESSLASPREPIGIFSSQMGEGWRSLEVSKTLFSNQEVCFHQESCRAYLFTAPASARIKILFRVALSRGSGPVLGMAGLSVAWGLMEVAGAELCT